MVSSPLKRLRNQRKQPQSRNAYLSTPYRRRSLVLQAAAGRRRQPKRREALEGGKESERWSVVRSNNSVIKANNRTGETLTCLCHVEGRDMSSKPCRYPPASVIVGEAILELMEGRDVPSLSGRGDS